MRALAVAFVAALSACPRPSITADAGAAGGAGAPAATAPVVTTRDEPISVTALDTTGCLAGGRPGMARDYAPPPFDACPASLHEIRPLPVFDEDGTRTRRARDPAACCYRFLGNR